MFFHTSDINHGLVVLPVYRFFPEGVDQKNKKTQWQLNPMAPARGQVRDVFLRRDQVSWIYLGEYQCVFSDVVDLNSVPFVKRNHVVQNTIMQKDLATRVSENMIKSMYTSSILKVQCFGLQCVGFNEELDRQLHDQSGKSGSAAPQSSPKAAGKKRKSGAEHKGPKPKKKKR
ncbi:hypothetical protein HETIRDRAFT_325418 [Heterobasidion irregulare TC 32-1]|uniref:Uncharacterized protein n=1 Tax=Heterobasidion irregulare (strain TC 32-1) TaxID=747525 RepID=W4JY01_HETIT|nr:uncharacterized protein HETIRDRAFT_325418 [Heterobasidion irregulare TC 32-1]ETW78413.1 hypothetical protein HETIRDRAFT_325418 [Heterobasidion irregulare TC 32-1]